MPNHITNIIQFKTTYKEMQSILERFTAHYPETPKTVFFDEGHVYKNKDDQIGWLDPKTNIFKQRGHMNTNGEQVESQGVPEGFELQMEPAWSRFPDFEKIIPMPKEIAETGNQPGLNPPWYRWSIDNWGTKWNSYENEAISLFEYSFQTAWASVPLLIEKISKEFPDTIIIYNFADEDTGHNCGCLIYKDGLVLDFLPEGGTIESYEQSFYIDPNGRDYYKLIDGKYEYHDEEE